METKTPSIQELNSLGVFSGRISEIHIKNMQSFPFIYFNSVQEAKLDYDISQIKDGKSYVHYDLKLKKKDNDFMEKRFLGLEGAIKTLFWKEIKLKLSINGKEYQYE